MKKKLFKIRGDIDLNAKKDDDNKENIGEYDYEDGFLVRETTKEDHEETQKALAWIRAMRWHRTQRVF